MDRGRQRCILRHVVARPGDLLVEMVLLARVQGGNLVEVLVEVFKTLEVAREPQAADLSVQRPGGLRKVTGGHLPAISPRQFSLPGLPRHGRSLRAPARAVRPTSSPSPALRDDNRGRLRVASVALIARDVGGEDEDPPRVECLVRAQQDALALNELQADVQQHAGVVVIPGLSQEEDVRETVEGLVVKICGDPPKIGACRTGIIRSGEPGSAINDALFARALSSHHRRARVRRPPANSAANRAEAYRELSNLFICKILVVDGTGGGNADFERRTADRLPSAAPSAFSPEPCLAR